MTAEPQGVVRVVRGPHRLLPSRTAQLGWLTALLSVGAVAVAQDGYRTLTLPIVAAIDLAVLYVVVLWRRDGRLPLFEVGTLWVAATVLYSTFPFAGFMALGLTWNEQLDARLAPYIFNLSEVRTFAWGYVIYIAAFVAVYLFFRGRQATPLVPRLEVPTAIPVALAIVLIGQYAFQLAMYFMYGVRSNFAYSELSTFAPQDQPQVPYFLWQITVAVVGSMLLVKQGLLLTLIRRWSSRKWRLLLLAWLAFEVIGTTVQMGSRGPAVRLLLSFVVLYHCFVRPIRARTVLLGGLILLIAFQIHGIVRLGNTQVRNLKASSVLTGPNEFEALFVTAYDIYKRKQAGTLGPIPWQVYFADAYLEIPSQLLPFQKIDPALWYLEVIGMSNTGVGFMFGVMAQAVVGLGWIELLLRGALLGLVCAAFHRWFARRAHRFWVTLLYLYVTIWIYYTFRATSFWLLHFVVYEFLPVMLVVSLLAVILQRVSRRRAAAPA